MTYKIHSLYYHNPEVVGFEKMMRWHLKHGYRFVSLAELRSILAERRQVKERLAFISFDDGWRGNLSLLPVVERYNVPICIFVATEPIRNGNFWWEFVAKEIGYSQMQDFKQLPYAEFCSQLAGFRQRNPLERSAMTADELAKLSKHPLVTIQSHTVSHPILTNVPDDVLECELSDSKRQIEALTNKEVFAFSYPNGSLSEREVEAARRHYALAFTTEQRNINPTTDDLHLLPRYALTGNYHRDLLKLWGVWKIIKKIKKGC